MRAIQIFEPGGPEVLTLVELPTPEPAPGEIRVCAEAIGVGRPDILVRKGTYKWMPSLPAIPGAELAGTVDALGDGVDHAMLGQRVLVSARELPVRGGCYAEYICVPAAAVFPLPVSVTPVDAISLPNFQLALALFKCNGDMPVESVLIPGSAGGVACALTQLAVARGIRVLGTVSTPEKAAFARANGVHELVSRDAAQMPAQVMDLTRGRGVDLAFDHLGAQSLIACIRSLAPMGMAVSYNVAQGAPSSDLFQELRAHLGRSLAVRTFSMHTLDEVPSVRRAQMEQAISLMASGAVQAPKAQLMRLTEIQRAHTALDSGASIGKIVIQP
jgi:NADPH2:quinone reductase